MKKRKKKQLGPWLLYAQVHCGGSIDYLYMSGIRVAVERLADERNDILGKKEWRVYRVKISIVKPKKRRKQK